jgi:hypothetical protein
MEHGAKSMAHVSRQAKTQPEADPSEALWRICVRSSGENALRYALSALRFATSFKMEET